MVPEPEGAISQQLPILRLNGLVMAEKRDRFSYYSLAQPRLPQLISCMEGCRIG